MQSFIMNSHKVFIHIHQGCFADTGAIVRLPQCQRSKPNGYGKISQCITTTKHSKAKTACIFLGIYCIPPTFLLYPSIIHKIRDVTTFKMGFLILTIWHFYLENTQVSSYSSIATYKQLTGIKCKKVFNIYHKYTLRPHHSYVLNSYDIIKVMS